MFTYRKLSYDNIIALFMYTEPKIYGQVIVNIKVMEQQQCEGFLLSRQWNICRVMSERLKLLEFYYIDYGLFLLFTLRSFREVDNISDNLSVSAAS